MAKIANTIIIEGKNMVHDALLSGQSIGSVIIASNSKGDQRIIDIQTLAKKKSIRVEIVRPEELKKYSDSSNPQSVVAMMAIPETPSLEEILNKKRDAFLILVNHIDYEMNLGAILRSAWAAGADAVIASPNGVHDLTPVVTKVSMGAAAYVPLIGMSLFQAIDTLNKYAVPVVGVEVEMGKVYTEAKLTGPLALVMGGEAIGLSEPLQKACDSFVNIPMKSGVASLNVSVASALVMFEKLRQEREV
jgi:23S rRNA (guanosine2251-2'-O)-methyltransferase